MYFYGVSDLSCSNETDMFSVNNDKAKLTYKTGLMSYREMNLLNNANARKAGQYYWLASPSYFGSYSNNAYEWYVNASGSMVSLSGVGLTIGVRPAVSLTPGIEYSDGDGSMENPYKIELGS